MGKWPKNGQKVGFLKFFWKIKYYFFSEFGR